jgi:hypothetical protein
MNELELLQNVRAYLKALHEMREAQKDYFKTRSTQALIRSKEYEKKIDSEHAEISQNIFDLWYIANEHQKQIENILND